MGNCCCRAAATWADDDDEWEPAEHEISTASGVDERTALRGDGRRSTAAVAAAAPTEVRLKLTKKELEKLLQKVDVQGLPVQEVLVHLLDAAAVAGGDVAGVYDRSHASSWRPILQSIPESPE